MSAFFTVVMILVCAVNIWNYNIISDRQDETLDEIIELETTQRDAPAESAGDFPIPGPFGGRSREARYMNRFFVVCFDKSGNVTSIDQEHIASVSAEDAEIYGREFLEKGKTSGYYKNYRCRLKETDSGVVIAFLNSEKEIQSVKTIFLVSGTIAVLSLAAVFALIIVFSGRAIEPYIRNIETQKQFITNAGHELKTPLTSISASADILAMEQGDNEWVKNIQTQASRMSKLVVSLVKLSRMDEGSPLSEKADFSLSEALWELSESAEALARSKNKVFTGNIEDGMTYYGDRSAIQQMVSALLDNAVKYSDDGGEITFTACRRRKRIEITVRNTVSPDAEIDLDRVFERFYRADKSRAAADSFGIGLSMAKAIAEKHRGTLKAERPDSAAVIFRITL